MPAYRAAILASLLFPLAAVPADAALPKLTSKLVLGKSIGGVAMGAKAAAAKKAWGSKGGTCTDVTCFYRVKGDSNGAKGEGSLTFTDGKVSYISLKTATSGKGYVFTTPFTTPKSDKGIGIGSTITALTKAYPKVKVNGNYYKVEGAKTYTEFTTANKKIVRIVIADNIVY